jgi:hypothetical protein
VLADNQHAVHRQLRTSAMKGFGDRRINLEIEFTRAIATQVALGLLVNV